jgi:methylenetetrahydrofolate reductase (NADPH)
VKDYGIALAIDMIGRIHRDAGITGFHFCTLNLEKSLHKVLEGLGWHGQVPQPEVANKVIAVRGTARTDRNAIFITLIGK